MKTISALVMMMMSTVAFAQVSKCVDSNGKIVGYGTTCPDGTRAEETGVRNAAPSAPAATPQQKSLAERDAEFRKRQMEKQESLAKAEKKSAEAEHRKRACDDSNAYLKSLQAGQRIGRTDPKTGERSYLADADYPKEIASAQRAVATSCK